MASQNKVISDLHAKYWQNDKLPAWQYNPKSKMTAVLYINTKGNKAALKKDLKGQLSEWQLAEVVENIDKSVLSLNGLEGPIWILSPYLNYMSNKGVVEDNKVALLRDLAGQWFRQSAQDLSELSLHAKSLSSNELAEVLYAFLLADYDSKKALKNYSGSHLKLDVNCALAKAAFNKVLQNSYWKAKGHNLSRHLTNLPPNVLNPESFSVLLQGLFAKDKSAKVEVWGAEKLKKENCGLLYHVGLGSEHGSRLVRVSYSPKKVKPLAFVGKGVTFDTGGLNLKPGDSMRYMKKDMSGASVVAGLAYRAIKGRQKTACEFYFAITENSVNEKATRPSDVHTSRSGKTVEIHNTDAEGRLAMADALTVATEKPGQVDAVIDVSTLTGAMRVSLGLDVAGYFSNDDKLAAKIEKSAVGAGELVWRQPLVSKYKKHFSSSIADFTNCGKTSFGGSITAALFLQHFVGDSKWAHFDVMAWNMGPQGAFTEGGNGQSFMTLSQLIDTY